LSIAPPSTTFNSGRFVISFTYMARQQRSQFDSNVHFLFFLVHNRVVLVLRPGRASGGRVNRSEGAYWQAQLSTTFRVVPVFSIIAVAATGLTAQSQRIERVALDVASTGASVADHAGSPADAAVRIGAVPVGDPIESVVTLREAELAYRMNAAVLGTAADMLDELLAVV
jgi:flagellar basal-body rod protein FlgC